MTDSGGRPDEDPRFELANDILRGVSHALQNRLASLVALAQLVEGADPSMRASLGQMLHDEAARLEAVAERTRLLYWEDEDPELVDLHAFARETTEAHRHHHAFADLTYEVVGADRPVGRVYRSALRYALLTLIGGAARLAAPETFEQGRIRIEVRQVECEARIEVSGCGGEGRQGGDGEAEAALRILREWGGATGEVRAIGGGYRLTLPAAG